MKRFFFLLLLSPSLAFTQEINNDVVSAASFGMTPGMKGAEVPMQKAVDWMLKNKKAGTLLIPAGVYYFNKGVLIGKDEDNNKTFDFVSIKISGSGKAYGGIGGNGAETTLWFNNPNDFGIGIQMGKGVTIQNLTLYGANDAPKPNYKAIATSRFDDYVKKGVRDNRYSPHAGIVIDPFGSRAAADQYPGWANSIPQQGTSGSTDIHISDCAFRQWVAGIANSVNGTKSNAECMLFENIWMENVAVGISSCQAQTKTVICRNLKVWGGCWKVLDTQHFGVGNGNGFLVEGANLAGGIKWICDAPAFGTGRTSLNYVFAELTYGIGGPDEDSDVVPQGRIDISQSQLDLVGQNEQYWNRANAIAKCGTLCIRDSYVGFYSGSDPSPMIVITINLVLDNVIGNQIYNFNFLMTTPEPHIYSFDNWYSGTEQARSRRIKLFYGDVFYFKTNEFTIRRQYIGRTFYVFESKGEVIKVDESTAVMIGSKNLLKGDILYVNGKVDFKIYMDVPHPVGVVSRINGDSVFISFSTLKTGQLSFFVIDQPELLDLSLWWGDIEAGSKNIKTRTVFATNRPSNVYKGKRIYNKNFPPGTYIVDWNDQGMMLSQPATRSSKNYSFTLSDYFVVDTLGRVQ